MIDKAKDDYKAQDVKFVEWSEDVSLNETDVSYIVSRLKTYTGTASVLDVGGGIGSLASVIADNVSGAVIDVVDSSPLARDHFISRDSVSLVHDNFLTLKLSKQYDAIIFRTVLHHIIANSDAETRLLQQCALEKARRLLTDRGRIFVTENFYEPTIGSDTPGAIIFALTRSQVLASVLRRLGANTAGEGVRFRSRRSWDNVFEAAALQKSGECRSPTWGQRLPIWQRLPLCCSQRFQAVIELRPT